METNENNNKVGMPEYVYLDRFGAIIKDVFGKYAYHVGSSLEKGNWRDVDIRLILEDEVYEQMGLGNPLDTHSEPKWIGLVLAFTELGRKLTGLPIDFQIQQQTYANQYYKGRRRAIGIYASKATMYEARVQGELCE